MVIMKNTLVMSKLDMELEKHRKEKEDLVKELEKAKNETATTEMRRQISFLKSTQSQASYTNQAQGMSFGNNAQITNNQNNTSLGTSSNEIKQNVGGTTSNMNTQNNIGGSSSQGFQKKPIFMESHR